jgi:hypothetical protein
MNFNSRDTYLAAVADWRVRYFAQIKLIRQLKLDFKAAQRAASKSTAAEYSKAWIALSNIRVAQSAAQEDIVKLVIERQDGREEANRQWHAARR